MFEPSPPRLPLPTKEPDIRVGIVLREDKIETLQAENLIEYLATNESAQIALLDKSFTLQAKNDRLSVEVSGETVLEGQVIKLVPKFVNALVKGSGLRLDPISVGRGFHWTQNIAASFPGSFEVRAHANQLEIINIVPFETYLCCVVTSEMGDACPKAFMAAQITAARSWAFVFMRHKHPDRKYDVCNDDDCQRYQGTTFLSPTAVEAAELCRGVYLETTSKTVLPAYYFKTCGGATDTTDRIFGFEEESIVSIVDTSEALPALGNHPLLSLRTEDAAKFCCGRASAHPIENYLGKVDKGGTHFEWDVRVANEDLSAILQEKTAQPVAKIVALIPQQLSDAGRITQLEVQYLDSLGAAHSLLVESQYEIRRCLSKSFLPSSAFIISTGIDQEFQFNGHGWGHGVGFCQLGALVLGLEGAPYQAILSHYFPKGNLVKAY